MGCHLAQRVNIRGFAGQDVLLVDGLSDVLLELGSVCREVFLDRVTRVTVACKSVPVFRTELGQDVFRHADGIMEECARVCNE